MKTYPIDSPQAVARLIAMVMITDARLDDREIDALERLHMLRLMGLSRDEFSAVVRAYCDEVVAAGSRDGKVDLMDRARIDAVVDAVQDPKKRLDAASMALVVMKADGTFHDAELALLRYTLARWGMSLDQLTGSPAR